MPGSIFGIPSRPTSGQGVIWSETLGGRMDVGADSQPASQLTGLTLNRVPFGNTLGGLQDSANLTFDGTTLTGSSLKATTLTSGRVTLASTGGLLADSAGLQFSSGATFAFTIGDGTGEGQAIICGASGSSKFTRFYTGNNTTTAHLRWDFGCDSAAEAGADAGSDFLLAAYSDTGGFIDAPMICTRAAGGAFTFYRPTVLASTLYVVGNTTTAALNATGNVTINSGAYLQIGNAYVATPTVGTGYVTIRDSAGVTYKVLVAT